MQRLIFIAALLIVSLNVFSQKTGTAGGAVQKIEPINPFVDSALALIDLKNLPDWRQYNHIPYSQTSYSRSDKNFAKIIGQINSLKYTAAEFRSVKSKLIQNAIAKIHDADERMYLKLHFFHHFLYALDADILLGNTPDLFTYIGDLDTSRPFAIRVKEVEAYGDLFAADGRNVSALKYYLGAEEAFEKCGSYYDAACVENKLGDLYCRVNKARQMDAGFQHYYKASSLFLKAGSPNESIKSRLRTIPFTPSYSYEIAYLEPIFNGYEEGFAFDLLGFKTNGYAWNYHEDQREEDSLSVNLYNHWLDTLTTGNYYVASKKGYDFMSEEKYDSALLSFQQALFLAVHDGYPNYSLPNVIEGLNNLGWAYSNIDSVNQAFSCIKWNARLNKRSKNTLSAIHSYFGGASNFCQLQKYDLALLSLVRGITLLDSLKLAENVKSDIKYRETKFALSQCDNNSFLSHINSGADTTARLGFVIEGDEMIRYEQRTKQFTLQQEIDSKKAILNQLVIKNDSLIVKQSDLIALGKILANVNDSLNIVTLQQQSKVDSEMLAILSLNKSGEKMTAEIQGKEKMLQKQDKDIAEKTKELHSISSYLADAIEAKKTAILVGCFLLGIGLLFYIIRIRTKNKRYSFLEAQYNYERVKLAALESQYNYERAKLTTLAKAKLHNIRGNYMKLMNLVDNKRYEVVAEYVENAAAYFAIILNRNNDASWTIEQELDLLSVFYNAEKNFYGEVEIVKKVDPKAKRAPFLSDIFTTLVHNSMRHGFTGQAGTKVFTVEVSVLSDWLHFTISDNGAAKHSKENYFPKDRQDNGLSILRERIINECVHKSREKRDDFFELHIGKYSKGTTLIFKYPFYETTTESVNS